MKVVKSSRLRVAVAVVIALALLTPAGAYALARVASVRAAITTHYPRQYTYETVTATVKDAGGRPIKGAKVVYTWRYKTTTPRDVRYTNSYGKAYDRRYISGATAGYKVVVGVTAYAGGAYKSTSTWFIPHR